MGFEMNASSPQDYLLLKSKRKNQKNLRNAVNLLPYLLIDNFGEQNTEGQPAREKLQKKETCPVAYKSTEQVLIAQDETSHQIFGSLHQSEKENEMKMVEKQMSNAKQSKRLNLFPNDSSIQMFQEMNADEIAWEDPKHLIRPEMKEQIEFCLKQKGEAMSDCLFECTSNSILDITEESLHF